MTVLLTSFAVGFTWIGFGIFGALHKIAMAVEAQNRHYGIGQPGESGSTRTEGQS